MLVFEWLLRVVVGYMFFNMVLFNFYMFVKKLVVRLWNWDVEILRKVFKVLDLRSEDGIWIGYIDFFLKNKFFFILFCIVVLFFVGDLRLYGYKVG